MFWERKPCISGALGLTVIKPLSCLKGSGRSVHSPTLCYGPHAGENKQQQPQTIDTCPDIPLAGSCESAILMQAAEAGRVVLIRAARGTTLCELAKPKTLENPNIPEDFPPALPSPTYTVCWNPLSSNDEDACLNPGWLILAKRMVNAIFFYSLN